jgi:molecular chaperone GrpE
MSDPSVQAPESGVDSGDPSAPVTVESAGADSIESSAGAELPETVESAGAELPETVESAGADSIESSAEAELAVAVDEALAARAAKADEYLDLAQRTRAEFENYRKRAIRDAAAAQERGALKLARELLPAVDNLERALAHAPVAEGENGAASFVSGIKHVHADVVDALKRVGIEWYSPEGEAFDPQYHEAVAQQPVDGAEPGTVVEVFQRGYRLGENVLRPARVVVAG